VDKIKFHPEHAWITVDGNLGTVGISDYAQQQLGEIIYVDLPKVDSEIRTGEAFCALESNKVASDVIAPVSGVVTEVNGALDDEPGLINSAPYTEGWLVKITLKDPSELDGLMETKAYEELTASL
jgi:glycine cleavage system H protein